MKYSDCARSALIAIRANAMRSLLTTLGIIIGVASVIVMVAVGEGARVEVDNKITSLGTNLLQLRLGSKRVRGRSVGANNKLPFSERDVAEIKRIVPGIVAISGHFRRGGMLIAPKVNWLTNVDGVHAGYLEVRDWEIETGSFFTEYDYQTAAKVIVLGSTVAYELFGSIDPVGEKIRIAEVPFQVIGMLEKKGASPSGKDQDDVALIPLSTLRTRLVKRHKLVPDQVGYVSVKLEDEEDLPEAKAQIEKILAARRGVKNKRSANFHVRDVTSYIKAKKATQRTFGLLLAATATISLIVGGIGIMNIMLVSVTERTREIGLRMAVGARRRDIRAQFLIEAIVLCFTGGLLGTLLGIVSTYAIAANFKWPVLISSDVIMMALAAAIGVGVFFGFFPAQRAARLNPIEALRNE